MTEEKWHVEHRHRVAGFPADIRDAHVHSSRHRKEIERSAVCGCFYCLAVFQTDEIMNWCDDDETAICPRCEIDAVIGAASTFPITEEFLAKMKSYWF